MNMNTSLRHLIGVATLGLAAACSHAQPTSWPSKPVRMVVPSPTGSAPDIIARVVADQLSLRWGKAVLIENKPGAGGLIGMGSAKQTGPDGHTLVFATAAMYTITPYMYRNDQVDVLRDFQPVAMICVGPMIAAVRADSPANSLKDVVALARKHPGEFVVATPSLYNIPFLAVELLSRASGVNMRPVSFDSSGRAISAVVNGDAQMLIDGIPPVDGMIKGGRLKAVAVFSEARMQDRPQVPIGTELHASLVFNGWFGVVAPVGTDARVVDRVNRDIGAVLAMAEVGTRFESLGVFPRAMTPSEFGTYWSDERVRWQDALRDLGVKPGSQ